MAATLIFLILSLLSTLHKSSAQQRPSSSNITPGSFLAPTSTNSSWQSHSGLYAFGFYPRSTGYAVGVFLAGIPENTVVWTAKRDDPPLPTATTLMLTTDGGLVLQQPQGQDVPIADPVGPISLAAMLDSGNFVLYNSDHEVVWQSFEHPTDTILPRQRLTPRNELVSSASETDHSSGIFRLKMQSDGNLVQYPADTPDAPPFAYYVSMTYGEGNNVTMNLDGDGSLYLMNSSSIIKNLTGGGFSKETKIFLTRIDPDGIFRVYSHGLDRDRNGTWSIEWNSTNDRCSPKGLCGLNGYCVPMDDKFDCKCLPGFDFVIPGNRSSGCERNLTAQSCKNKDEGIKFSITPVENTVWENVSYSELSSMSREDCQKACLDDCNCEAAIYNGGTCSKQRLPLRYGRKPLSSDSSLALVKISNGNPLNEVPPKKSKKGPRLDILIIGVSLIAVAFLVMVVSGAVVHRYHVWAYKKISENGNVKLFEDVAPREFTYAELELLTNGFKEELGRGACGIVYKGIIPCSQKLVAVKRLDKMFAEGEREFQTEIKVIGKTHHRNLVRLIGYCLEGPNRLLVYEYMSNGSLSDILFTPEKRPNWDERIGIALDIARGVLYLHEECETQIIHCDIKP